MDGYGGVDEEMTSRPAVTAHLKRSECRYSNLNGFGVIFLVLVVLIACTAGCASPKVTERARIERTPNGWAISSFKDQFEMSAEIDGAKVNYSSKTPGLVESIIKGGASIGGSIGQAMVTQSVLDGD